MGLVREFGALGIDDVKLVGGKNASLGEMLQALEPLGVRVPPGFAITADGYRAFLAHSGLVEPIEKLLAGVDGSDVDVLAQRSQQVRELISKAPFPEALAEEIRTAYRALSSRFNSSAVDVAVRSSATAEDLPTASFAGQQETFLNVQGDNELLDAVRRCFASLFTARAISYRLDMGFGHLDVALSVGVQKMVRSDLSSAGVIFTLDTESGHRGFVMVTSSWGLGENIVQGKVRFRGGARREHEHRHFR